MNRTRRSSDTPGPQPVQTVRHVEVPGRQVKRGKVRDLFDLGDELLLVATDRISAFDCVLPDPIPHKGAVLTALSGFWFDRLAGQYPHHLIEIVRRDVPSGHIRLLPGLPWRFALPKAPLPAARLESLLLSSAVPPQ